MQTDSVALEYEVAGTGEPVVFIHGALICDTFRPLLTEPSLADRYQLILYHRRGYGGSSAVSGPISVNQQTADCQALLDHLGVERAHIAGHSYGGVVALQFALDAPDMVQSLALMEPALIAGESAQGYQDSLEQGVERYRDVGPAVVVNEFLEARLPGFRAILDRVLPGAFEQAVVDARTSFDSELPGLIDWHFGEDEARKIHQPALSVRGGESVTLSPRFEEVHRLLQEWLPDCEGFVLPGTRHLPQIEDPRGLAETLATFFSRHPIPSGRV